MNCHDKTYSTNQEALSNFFQFRCKFYSIPILKFYLNQINQIIVLKYVIIRFRFLLTMVYRVVFSTFQCRASAWFGL